MNGDDTPVEVIRARTIVDRHRNGGCYDCNENGSCPTLNAARETLDTYRAVRGSLDTPPVNWPNSRPAWMRREVPA